MVWDLISRRQWFVLRRFVIAKPFKQTERRFVITYCDGKAGEEGEELHARIEQEFIPLANKMGFESVILKRGPVIRSFHTVALVGYKG